jgi:hypothetical protein
MTWKDIRTSQPDVACDVCGRTLLRGERSETYLAAGAPREVCELCSPRAVHEGWVRERDGHDLEARSPGIDDRRSLLSRLRSRRTERPQRGQRVQRARRPSREPDEHAPGAGGLDVYEVQPGHPPADEPVEASSAPSPAAGAPEPAPPAAAPAAPAPAPPPPAPARSDRQVRAVPTGREMRMSRALELFNASSHPRTVAGVARSLGPPTVRVRPIDDESGIVLITVSWELSWYRYEVDLSQDIGGVRVDAQGDELEELTDEDKVPNAAADERGGLSARA